MKKDDRVRCSIKVTDAEGGKNGSTDRRKPWAKRDKLNDKSMNENRILTDAQHDENESITASLILGLNSKQDIRIVPYQNNK
jgi:hypothetical protein